MKNKLQLFKCKLFHYNTIRKVEKVLGFKLRDSQILYIFNNDRHIMMGGRANGKTLSHQLKLILSYKEKPIDFSSTPDSIVFTDFFASSANSQREYMKWYLFELRKLYERCKSANIKVREIKW